MSERITKQMLINRLAYVAKHLGDARKGDLGLDIYEPGRGKLYALTERDPVTKVANRLSEYMPLKEFWRYLTGLNEAAEWVRTVKETKKAEQNAEAAKLKRFIDYALEQWGLIDDGETLTRVRRRYQLMKQGLDITYRCPRGNHPSMDLERCAARKERKHHGCVTCKVPGQKTREIKQARKEAKHG